MSIGIIFSIISLFFKFNTMFCYILNSPTSNTTDASLVVCNIACCQMVCSVCYVSEPRD